MQYLIIGLIVLSFALNVGLMLYFVDKFESMFIIMKAWSLKDLMDYYKNLENLKSWKDIEEEEEYVP